MVNEIEICNKGNCVILVSGLILVHNKFYYIDNIIPSNVLLQLMYM